jgi:hypothetical protein
MPIDFPNSPTLNETFSSGERKWIWNGTVWKIITEDTENVVFNTQTSPYTITISDRNKIISMNSSFVNDVTVPLNATEPFPLGAQIIILQSGTGQTVVTPVSGVIINGTPGLKLRAQWSTATLIKRDTDSWLLLGDLSS